MVSGLGYVLSDKGSRRPGDGWGSGKAAQKQKGKLQLMAVGGLSKGESSSCPLGGCSPGLGVGLKPSLT